jgi:putative aminopeptidase FrvX
MGDRHYTGTILLNDPSVHANKRSGSSERNIDTMHVRVDEEVENAEGIEKLGIRVGDIIAVEPRYQELPNGFIKSHFLDNKAGCHVLLDVARQMNESGSKVPVELFFSTYEEVGHGGASGYSDSLQELLVIDMGVVGAACEGSETACSICVKDSSGPYDYNFRKTLTELADAKKIPYALDVYPFYGSDGSAALRAGRDYRVALIGPGVAASHGMERTHMKAINATVDLCLAYIQHVGG